MDNLTLKPQYLLDNKGKQAFVVLTIEEYQQLLEDLHDLTIMSQRRNEERMSLDNFEEMLVQNDLL